MFCPICNTEMVAETVKYNLPETYSHVCKDCDHHVTTEEDDAKTLEHAQNMIGGYVLLNAYLCRFHTYSAFLGVKLKIQKVNIVKGYITCDLSHIDNDDIVVENITPMFLHDIDTFYVGDLVKFNSKVFEEPYIPYYDDYVNHTFMIEKIIVDDEDPDYKPVTHYQLRCVTGNVTVQGNVHQDEIVPAWKLF